jgi:hypothetical protein
MRGLRVEEGERRNSVSPDPAEEGAGPRIYLPALPLQDKSNSWWLYTVAGARGPVVAGARRAPRPSLLRIVSGPEEVERSTIEAPCAPILHLDEAEGIGDAGKRSFYLVTGDARLGGQTAHAEALAREQDGGNRFYFAHGVVILMADASGQAAWSDDVHRLAPGTERAASRSFHDPRGRAG